MLNISFIPFNKKSLSAGVIIMLAILFMWISAESIYGQYAEMVRNTMMIYFFMFLITYVFANQPPKSLLSEKLSNFLIGFFGTGAILLLVSWIIGGLAPAAFLSEPLIATITITGIGFGVLHAFVKAYIEESVFRWALPKLFGLGDILANIAFGLFHLSILLMITIPNMIAAGNLADIGAMNYTYAIYPVFILIMLGLIWSQVRNHLGIMGSTGSHTAWNMFALGILPMIFLGGIA